MSGKRKLLTARKTTITGGTLSSTKEQSMKQQASGPFMKMTVALTALCMMLGFSSWAFGYAPQAQAAPKGLEGTWQGVLGGGDTKLRLVLTISKSSDGLYRGMLDSLDQGATIPIDKISLDGDAVRLEVNSVGGVYEGSLNKERSEIQGKWTQGGIKQDLNFQVGASSPVEASAAGKAPPKPTQKPLGAPVDVEVPKLPTAFQADGKTHLVYELHVTNFGAADCSITQIDVLRADDKKSLGHFEGVELAGMLNRPGVTGAVGMDKLRLGPGLRAVVYLWVTFDKAADVPSALEHRVTVKVGDYPDSFAVDSARISGRRDLPVIGPPLRGGEWLAANGPSNSSGHRRALIPIGGRAQIAQRFAIDWVQLRPDGQTFTGDQLDNKNYRAYGSEVLAVADGVASEVVDGIPQNVPGEKSRAVPITLETVGGNHVILDLGQGRYAFYAHLQPGSVRIKTGDKVRRGQVLGLVGNSGNSTEPHLHFHLSDASSPLGSEGIPYALESYQRQGKGTGWKPSSANSAPEKRLMEIPLENEIVSFDQH
jgi:murein DD-endopeptidase